MVLQQVGLLFTSRGLPVLGFLLSLQGLLVAGYFYIMVSVSEEVTPDNSCLDVFEGAYSIH